MEKDKEIGIKRRGIVVEGDNTNRMTAENNSTLSFSFLFFSSLSLFCCIIFVLVFTFCSRTSQCFLRMLSKTSSSFEPIRQKKKGFERLSSSLPFLFASFPFYPKSSVASFPKKKRLDRKRKRDSRELSHLRLTKKSFRLSLLLVQQKKSNSVSKRAPSRRRRCSPPKRSPRSSSSTAVLNREKE